MRRWMVYLSLVLTLVLVVGCQPAKQTPAAANVPDSAIALQVIGPNATKVLSLDDVKKLPATTGWAGIKNSAGKITIPETYKGVTIEELCKLVGGIGPDQAVNLVAKDGYAMTLSYDQAVKGDLIAYDPGTGDEITVDEPLKPVIAYEREGKALPEESDGTFRLVVVTSKGNQVTDGHWSVKWIRQVVIKSMAEEWTLHLEGNLVEDMDRATFESGAAPNCHQATWTDDKGQVWTGIPLWLLVGRVDDDVKHQTRAFDDDLAKQGYKVDVVASDGYTVSIDSTRFRLNDNILVALRLNDNPLGDEYFPLRLVGSDVKSNEMVGKITKIVLHLPAAAAPPATPVPATPEPTQSTGSTTPASAAALTITGAVDKELTLSLDELKALGTVKISAEHPKKGMQDYEGVHLSVLFEKAGVKAEATKIVSVSSDNYTSEIAMADVRACADCMVAIDSDGALNLVMPGLQSSSWSKYIVSLEFK